VKGEAAKWSPFLTVLSEFFEFGRYARLCCISARRLGYGFNRAMLAVVPSKVGYGQAKNYSNALF
jgi:hypothetical protein